MDKHKLVNTEIVRSLKLIQSETHKSMFHELLEMYNELAPIIIESIQDVNKHKSDLNQLTIMIRNFSTLSKSIGASKLEVILTDLHEHATSTRLSTVEDVNHFNSLLDSLLKIYSETLQLLKNEAT